MPAGFILRRPVGYNYVDDSSEDDNFFGDVFEILILPILIPVLLVKKLVNKIRQRGR